MYIFQYGSNCDEKRLNSPDRLQGAARSLGKAQTADEFELEFDVYSKSNHCGASDIVPRPGSGKKVWGVLYDVPADLVYGSRKDGRRTLEQIEGALYRPQPVLLDWNGSRVEAITFVVRNPVSGLKTSKDYVGHIIHGLRAHEVEEDYIESVRQKAIINNPQEEDAFRGL